MIHVMAFQHGTRDAYGKGCRCTPCTLANAEYQRNYRARGTGAKASTATVRPVRTLTAGTPRTSARRPARGQESAPQDRPGELETVVASECERLAPGVEYAAECVGARRMAQILDRPDLAGLHVKASVELERAMKVLRDPKGPQRKSKGRLAKVQQLRRVK
jgi:hypothetical protein